MNPFSENETTFFSLGNEFNPSPDTTTTYSEWLLNVNASLSSSYNHLDQIPNFTLATADVTEDRDHAWRATFGDGIRGGHEDRLEQSWFRCDPPSTIPTLRVEDLPVSRHRHASGICHEVNWVPGLAPRLSLPSLPSRNSSDPV